MLEWMISTVVMYANKGDIRKTKKTEDSGAFSNVEYKHENTVAVLTMHASVVEVESFRWGDSCWTVEMGAAEAEHSPTRRKFFKVLLHDIENLGTLK